MANYLSDRTGASIDTVLDDADAGNIGKVNGADFSGDVDSVLISGFTRISGTATSIPLAESGGLLTTSLTSTNTTQIFHTRTNKAYIRGKNNSVWSAWQELYHTGNTGNATFAGITPDGSKREISLGNGVNLDQLVIGTDTVSSRLMHGFFNPNGLGGSITLAGTATSYNTSSDPRLKDFAEAPTDSAINTEFNSLYSCFRTFNWKSDPQGDLVWGFDAHACIDAKTNLGSEGEGSRSLNLGDTYETIPAVTESRVVNDAEGNPTSEIETVVITAAIEKKVSPAGVDQSKAVPVLLAKIEQLERRLTLAGL